jgi:hypothetical protein
MTIQHEELCVRMYLRMVLKRTMVQNPHGGSKSIVAYTAIQATFDFCDKTCQLE